MTYPTIRVATLVMSMLLVAAVQAGCSMPVTVNGKKTTLGAAFGSDDSAKKGESKGEAKQAGEGDAQTISAGQKIALGGPDTKSKYRLTTEVSGTVRQAKQAGWPDCSYRSMMLDEPLAVLDVQKKSDFIVEVYGEKYNHGFLITLPGNKHICKNMPSQARLHLEWEPGEYAIYPIWSRGQADKEGSTASKELTVAITTKVRSGAPPTFKITADTPNPWQSATAEYDGSVHTTRAWSWKCGRNAWMSSAPIAKLEFTEDTQRTIALQSSGREAGMILKSEEGKGWCHGSSTTRDFKRGTYTVYAKWGKSHDELRPIDFEEPPQFKLLTYKEGEPVDLKDGIPRHEIGKLAEPKVLRGTTLSDKAHLAKYKCKHRSIRYATNPDFFVQTTRPLSELKFQVIDYTGELNMKVIDVSDDGVQYTHRPRCNRDSPRETKIGTADGEYAVFLGDDGESHDYILLVSEKDTKLDPLMRVEDVPKDLPLNKRWFGRWHPLKRDFKNSLKLRMRMWREVPDQLLVYPVRDLDEASATRSVYGKSNKFQPKKGEPLLVTGVKSDRKGNPDKVHVMTTDLARFTVLASQLSTDKPDNLVVPAKPRDDLRLRYGHLLSFATERQKKRDKQIVKMKKRADDCYYDYWEKHHGSTPSGVDLYEVTYDSKGNVKRVQNYSDKVHKRALRACPVERAQKAHNRLKKQMAETFDDKRAELMQGVAKRLE